MLEVLEPGLLSTVQDAGRPGSTDLGVPISGACDPWSLAVANALAGADLGAPAVEMTIVGSTFRVLDAGRLALAGADLGGWVRETGRRLLPGRIHVVEEGSTLEFPGPADPRSGSRAYVGLPGGVAIPSVLGSASTCLVGRFGGLAGRPLEPGDRLGGSGGGGPSGLSEMRTDAVWAVPGDPAPGWDPSRRPIRVVAGPHLDRIGAEVLEALLAARWTVADGSDRVGLRLRGPDLVGAAAGAVRDSWPELPSHGVTWGTIQVPPDGAPIVLLVDHQTTGGYPVVAVAVGADRPRLGQLRPGSTVRFEQTDLATARAALLRQRATLLAGVAALEDPAGPWDDLWRSAGG
ncbi:MAG: biotin-dependent carboxyltransferase family protein [Chloroflexi bacterium]|nr:MAG: biotin-dependent carboxyltransferase family protein [Chloroflexota bacterium]